MAESYLRKIILEELKKVLKEQEDFGPGSLSYGGSARGMKSPSEFGAQFDQKIQADSEKFTSTSKRGMSCDNAMPIQQALKNKLSLMAQKDFDKSK